MSLSVGIVGLPNVGKSTLFNALLKKQQALAANYPFATIEPNVGVVPVPDSRLEQLAEIEKEELKLSNLPPLKPATIEFVDIAGLVKGASEGAGLGNKFLSHIREVSVIAHVVRAFDDTDVIREGSVDTKTDYEIINTELMLADLAAVLKAKENRKLEPSQKSALEKLEKALNEGKAVRSLTFSDEEQVFVNSLFLLSAKPEIVVLNIGEDEYTEENLLKYGKEYSEILDVSQENIVVVSAKVESELASFSDEEQKEYLANLGLKSSGLERLIQKAYASLGLISFLTAGEIEVRAWTIKKGSSAPQAAGVIHTDFIKNFIKAEVVSFDEFVTACGWKKARELGKSRMEGKDYIMHEGDVVEFKIGR